MKKEDSTQKYGFSDSDTLVNLATGSAAAFISLFTVTVLVVLSMLLR
jgi:hypothetical protein